MKRTVCLIAAIIMIPAFMFNAGFSYGAENSQANLDYMENQIIAVFKDDVTKKGAEKIVSFCISEESPGNGAGDRANSRANQKYRISKIETDSNAMLISFSSKINEPAVAQSLSRNPDVESAQPNYIYTVDSRSSSARDGEDSDPWYLKYVNAKQANQLISRLEKKGSIPGGRSPVRLAILDSGALTDHKDLRGMVNEEKCVSTTYDESDGPAYSIKKYGKPDYSSGTESAGIAATLAGGNSKAIEIMAVKVFRKSQKEQLQPISTSVDIVSGIDYSCRENARIIAMCFSHRLNSSDNGKAFHGDPILETKIEKASTKDGVLFVSSAGNGNTEAELYPSDIKACISCINTIKYSDTDSPECRNAESNFGSMKNISAPGTEIYTTSYDGGYAKATGTSASAAIVASAAALVMYVNPDLNANQVKDILCSTTTDLYQPGYDEQTGHGNLNVYRAVAKAAGIKVNQQKVLERPVIKVKSGEEKGLVWKKIEKTDAYYVFRSSGKDGDFVRVAIVPSDRTGWTDKDAEPGHKYFYKLSAHGSSEDGQRTDSARSKAVEIKYGD